MKVTEYITDGNIMNLFLKLFIWLWLMHSIASVPGIQYDNSTFLHTMLTLSAATICRHKMLLQYHWLYSLHCTSYSHDLIIP